MQHIGVILGLLKVSKGAKLIWKTYKLIALQLTLVPMLNLTAVVFISVLDIAGKPLYNVACVIIVHEQSVFSTKK